MKWLLFVPLMLVGVASQCPNLILPWGTYTAVNDSTLTCNYTNVRFASPPIGNLRFAAPEYPPAKGVSPGPPPEAPYPGCYAMEESPCNPGRKTGDNKNTGCLNPNFSNMTEDCLFLDIYVPKRALSSKSQVPVVVWFYGGAYVFGSKTQFDPKTAALYDGGQIALSSDEPVIFVAGNYRLGALGWLAGDYMEKNAQPNAGLLDQQAVLQFVRDHIHLLNGDNENVSAWGESAGASSVLHHLIMPDNVKDPLFHRAILQSPAYQFLWDRKGGLNQTYMKFSNSAGCPDNQISCLRNADINALLNANQDLLQELWCNGIMPVGPSVDGNLVPDIPSNLFSQSGKFTKLNSVIVSHVDLEVKIVGNLSKFSFVPQPIRENPSKPAYFDKFLEEIMPGEPYAKIRASIDKQYPSYDYLWDQVKRAQHVIKDGSFVCNTRIILDAYSSASTPVYAMDYAFLADFELATHASDLIPTFVTGETNYTGLFECEAKEVGKSLGDDIAGYVVNRLGPGMQQYFANHAVHGDPNQGSTTHANVTWEQAVVGKCGFFSERSGCVTNTMRPSYQIPTWRSPFYDNTAVDEQSAESVCGFWRGVAQQITAAYNSQASDTQDAETRFEHEREDQIIFEGEL